jgi:hypothetical protein
MRRLWEVVCGDEIVGLELLDGAKEHGAKTVHAARRLAFRRSKIRYRVISPMDYGVRVEK